MKTLFPPTSGRYCISCCLPGCLQNYFFENVFHSTSRAALSTTPERTNTLYLSVKLSPFFNVYGSLKMTAGLKYGIPNWTPPEL